MADSHNKELPIWDTPFETECSRVRVESALGCEKARVIVYDGDGKILYTILASAYVDVDHDNKARAAARIGVVRQWTEEESTPL